MIVCDLCDQAKECKQREIEGKEYDICAECWSPLAEKREEPMPAPEGPPRIIVGFGSFPEPHVAQLARNHFEEGVSR
jgi:hypothetical protein